MPSPTPAVRTASLLRAAALGVALLAPATLPALVAPASAQTVPDSVTVPDDLQILVEDFWHYGKIARYDVAAQKGQAILDAGAEPQQVLKAFETVVLQRAATRGDLSDLDAELVRWQSVDDAQMTDVTGKIDELLNKGRYTVREDPGFITSQIERLGVNGVAYDRAMDNLRRSGELAVPFMLDYLQDPTKVELHTSIRRALRDLGRLALNPLVAATQTQDNQLLTTVLLVLGDIGYDDAVPYIARVEQSGDYPQGVRQAARQALAKFDTGGQGVPPAADLFYRLGEKLYYDQSALSADARVPTASIYSFAGGKLQRTEVVPAIFNEIMAMREAEYALSLAGGSMGGNARTAGDRSGNTAGPSMATGDASIADQALALWLAADYKREASLPDGGSDPTRPEGSPDANYYGVTSGASYLYEALARALRDRDSAVAMKVIRSLQEIVGQAGLSGGPGGANPAPLIAAMNYPDRRVRFEAAFALAAALPTQPFGGQEQVVPLLVEALSSSGSPGALLVMQSQDAVARFAEPLEQAGYTVAGAGGAAETASAASQLKTVDVVVIDGSLPPDQVEQALSAANSSPALRNATKLVLTQTAASPYAGRAALDPSLNTAIVADPSGLAEAIGAARVASGQLSIDAGDATDYATRAGELLRRAAIDTGDVYDLTAGRNGLLAALSDDRPEVVTLAAQALGLIDADGAQPALLERATADGGDEGAKVALFQALAQNAKRFGDKLSPQQVNALDGVVAGDAPLDVRSAAAEARGALDLPPDQAKALILKQSKVVGK